MKLWQIQSAIIYELSAAGGRLSAINTYHASHFLNLKTIPRGQFPIALLTPNGEVDVGHLVSDVTHEAVTLRLHFFDVNWNFTTNGVCYKNDDVDHFQSAAKGVVDVNSHGQTMMITYETGGVYDTGSEMIRGSYLDLRVEKYE